MPFRIIKHDFTKDELCQICKSGRVLKEAFFLNNETTKKTIIASQSCVHKIRNEILNWKGPYADFTKGIIHGDEGGQGENGGEEVNGPRNGRQRIEYDIAIEYLILRQEKLKDFDERIPHYRLRETYENYIKEYKLSDESKRYLNNFILKTNRDYPEYKLEVLRRLYSADFWLDYVIERTDDKRQKFLKSIQNYHRKNWGITIKQKESIDNTFSKLNEKWPKNMKIPNVDFIILNENK